MAITPFGPILEEPETTMSEEDELYKYTFSGDWDNVVRLYDTEPWLQSSWITSSKDTALHMAINDDREDPVERLVELIRQSRNDEALKGENNRGETPLHRAAARGSVRMCERIVKAGDELGLELLSTTSKLGETPVFTAALHNRKPAFIFLHCAAIEKYKRDSEMLHKLLRRDDDTGDTVLHSAIRREHFDLAFHVIQLYPDLMYKINVEGMTPLHVLASKPYAFRSGCSLSWWKQIIYYCIYVDLAYDPDPKSPDSSEAKWPENYLTCYQFFSKMYSGLKNFWKSMWRKDKSPGSEGKKDNRGDAENPRDLHAKEIVPQNYATCYEFSAFVFLFLFRILLGKTYYDLEDAKRKHTWSIQILNELMQRPGKAYISEGGDPGEVDFYPERSDKKTEDQNERGTSGPALLAAAKGVIEAATKSVSNLLVSFNDTSSVDKNILLVAIKNKQPDQQEGPGDTVLLMAAKNGVLEVVDKILRELPVSIHDTSSTNKNILLVAVENRQPEVVEALRKYLTQVSNKTNLWHDLIQSLDFSENTILHLAAKYDESAPHPWKSHGSVMVMQWEIKWYEYVKSLTPPHFDFLANKEGQTPEEIFTPAHDDLVKDSSKWLKEMSESCSAAAVLVAGVTFATSSQVPGGNDENTGEPNLKGKPAFELFSITVLMALGFSVTALIMFLSLLTSRKQPRDFKRSLPRKLLLGLSSLFVSISLTLIAFCAAHFFLIDKDFKRGVVFALYVATCLPASYYAVTQFGLYWGLLKAIVRKVPKSHL